jgi:hypothetical protein
VKLGRLTRSESSSGSSFDETDLTQRVDIGCDVRYDLRSSSPFLCAEPGNLQARLGDANLGRKSDRVGYRSLQSVGVGFSEESRKCDTMAVERADSTPIPESVGRQYWTTAPFEPGGCLRRLGVFGTNLVSKHRGTSCTPSIRARPCRISILYTV